MEILREHNQEDLIFLAAGATLFGTTFLTSRGNHSKIHKEILAPVALGSEAVTALSGLGLLLSENEYGRNIFLRKAARIGLAATLACHIAVALTDVHVVNHFQSGRGFNYSDLLDLGGKFFDDFKRHTRIG